MWEKKLKRAISWFEGAVVSIDWIGALAGQREITHDASVDDQPPLSAHNNSGFGYKREHGPVSTPERRGKVAGPSGTKNNLPINFLVWPPRLPSFFALMNCSDSGKRIRMKPTAKEAPAPIQKRILNESGAEPSEAKARVNAAARR